MLVRPIRCCNIPAGIPAGQSIDVLFAIRPSGELRGAVVPDTSPGELEDSILEALQAAAPFPPLDDITLCLADRTVRANFSNPELR